MLELGYFNSIFIRLNLRDHVSGLMRVREILPRLLPPELDVSCGQGDLENTCVMGVSSIGPQKGQSRPPHRSLPEVAL